MPIALFRRYRSACPLPPAAGKPMWWLAAAAQMVLPRTIWAAGELAGSCAAGGRGSDRGANLKIVQGLIVNDSACPPPAAEGKPMWWLAAAARAVLGRTIRAAGELAGSCAAGGRGSGRIANSVGVYNTKSLFCILLYLYIS